MFRIESRMRVNVSMSVAVGKMSAIICTVDTSLHTTIIRRTIYFTKIVERSKWRDLLDEPSLTTMSCIAELSPNTVVGPTVGRLAPDSTIFENVSVFTHLDDSAVSA